MDIESLQLSANGERTGCRPKESLAKSGHTGAADAHMRLICDTPPKLPPHRLPSCAEAMDNTLSANRPSRVLSTAKVLPSGLSLARPRLVPAHNWPSVPL